MRHVVGAVTMAATLAVGATGQATAEPEAPISYAAARCGYHVAVNDSPKGPVVTVTREGATLGTTMDANLAHKSRRFFFKLRTASTLIEFQGHAYQTALDGMLSDEAGTRHVLLPVASIASAKCEDTR